MTYIKLNLFIKNYLSNNKNIFILLISSIPIIFCFLKRFFQYLCKRKKRNAKVSQAYISF